jgi:dihydrofolate synthase/folylpolyglutamate synthase
MIATALTASGKKTGLHTKPHLTAMTERMRIDGVPISKDGFGELFAEMRSAIEKTAAEESRPTYYETLLALAFTSFAREHVDVAVIEVGVGGTLDGTNVVEPEVSVITNVGLDHTDILGNTTEEIAFDKAGIAKRGVPLVSQASGGAREVIEAVARSAGAPFIGVDDVARVEDRASERYGQSFRVTTALDTYDLDLPILGRFQQRNAATAIVALEQLEPDLRPSREAIERGFTNLVIPGRMEFFPAHPAVIFDVAHNPDKAGNLADALLETFPNRRFVFVVAIGESKDALEVLKRFFPLPASFIFTSFAASGRSATSPARLLNMAEQHGLAGRAIADPVEALSIARRSSDANSIVVVTGSTFVVATLRDWWLANVVERSHS